MEQLPVSTDVQIHVLLKLQLGLRSLGTEKLGGHSAKLLPFKV